MSDTSIEIPTVDKFYTEIELAVSRAAPLFRAMGWTYGGDLPPTYYALEATVTRLVKSCLHDARKPNWDGYSSCGSGRFIVSYRRYEGENTLSIRLELAHHTEFK